MSREKGKREDILKAATEVFGSKGFYLANMIDIAERAGIGKATIYEYFKSKVVRLLVEILSQGRKESVIRDTDIEFAADMLLEMIIRCSIRSVLLNLSDKQIQQENEKLLDLFMLGAGNAINYCK